MPRLLTTIYIINSSGLQDMVWTFDVYRLETIYLKEKNAEETDFPLEKIDLYDDTGKRLNDQMSIEDGSTIEMKIAQ